MGTGIEIGALSVNNEIVRNTANTNSGEGIAVEDTAPAGQGNLIEGNVADGNGGDGIAIAGVGHILKDNSAQMNGGWGIYAAVGVIDRGGNYAAGNIEPQQCYNVVCAVGAVPGEPETWIVDKPPLLSHSRNACFTYRGSDDVSLERELVFECRIDTSDPLAWEDCEYPAEILNLMPGPAHVRDPRDRPAGRRPARLLAGPLHLDLRAAAAERPARGHPRHRPGARDLARSTQIFTFHSNEPDVTFECKVDQFGYEPCGFESAQYMSQGAFEWGLEETEVGPHTFYVRAIDFEGNDGEPTTYTWSLLGVATDLPARPEPEIDRLHAAGDAVRPGDRQRDR